MSRLLPILALSALAASHSPAAPSPSGDTVQVPELATLTDAEAVRLHGRRHWCWVRIDGPEMITDHYEEYQCKGEGEAISRTVWFVLGEKVNPKVPQRVEGTLLVINHPPRVILGTEFVGFTEYRLVGARRR